MSIAHYIKEVGRGKKGARSLTRAQAADAFQAILHHLSKAQAKDSHSSLPPHLTDLEIGAFCMAMRFKGESPEEMAGFGDAVRQTMRPYPVAEHQQPVVVIPSYNGGRKLPVLTPLLALLLAQRGVPVILHGSVSESTATTKRVPVQQYLDRLSIPLATEHPQPLRNAEVVFVNTDWFHPGLAKLLQVRRVVGVRNSGHAVVKLISPLAEQTPHVLVTSYTHPEYALSMSQALQHLGGLSLLLRGTEGEAVAHPKRIPPMQSIVHGHIETLENPQSTALPDQFPESPEVELTTAYIQQVLNQDIPVPAPLARQVEHILRLVQHAQQPCVAG